MGKQKTYSIYLAKPDVTTFKELLSASAQEKLNAGEVLSVDTDKIGDNATVFVFQSLPRPPSWLADVSAVFEAVPDIRNKASCAVIVFRHVERIFATTFAHGWQYVDDAKIVSDFGLRVAINSLADSKVRSVDRSHLGEAIKGVSKSAFQRDLQAFGVDEALDLVRRISGRTEDSDFANGLSGATSLKITREMNLFDIAEVAADALHRSQLTKYKATSFHIIDKVRPVLDKVVLSALESLAVERIKNEGDNFELSMPGWSEDDVVYYGFKGPGLTKRFPDLLMANYREALGDGLKSIDVETISKKHKVFAEFNNDIGGSKEWSIKKSLVGSVTHQGGLYAVSEGEWFRLDEQFKNEVDAAFFEARENWPKAPLVIIQKVIAKNKVGFESELEYNRRCAIEYDQLCLDQKIISVPETPYGKFEACDLLDILGKRLIHVKKSSRQSSVLSHFFKQGSNSAKILKTIPESRQKLIDMVRKEFGDADADELELSFGGGMSGWKVEFHIVDAPRDDGNFMIPFFSRITLRDEMRMMRGMELAVSLRFIPSPKIKI